MAAQFGNGTCRHVARCPCGLEVETSGDAVDVERFAGNKQTGAAAALERRGIYAAERHAPAGNELFFETALAVGMIYVGRKRCRQFVHAFAAHLSPPHGRVEPAFAYYVRPKAGVQLRRISRSQLFLRVVCRQLGNGLHGFLCIAFAEPVDGYVGFVAVGMQQARRMGRQL